MSATLVRTDRLSLAFDDGRTMALDEVGLEVMEGDFVALSGPSGCGKSSLLNLVGMLDRPSGGEIYFRAQPYADIHDRSTFRRNHIGFIFQGFNLLPTLCALDNVLVPTVGAGGTTITHRRRARQLLDRLGIGGLVGRLPAQLSGGERQRVAVARALINSPSMVLADEPTGSLDSTSAQQVLDLVAQCRVEDRLTVLMASHDPAVSARADRVVYLRDGRLAPPPEPRR